MTPTVLPSTRPRQLSPVDKVSARLAFLRGCSMGTAHTVLYRSRDDYKQAVQAHLDVGAVEALMRYHGPIDALFDSAPTPELTPSVVHAAQAADMHEDIAESDWHADPSPETLTVWLRRLYTQRQHTSTMIRALEALKE